MACGVRAAIETGATIQGQCGGSDWQFAAGMATPQRKARGGNGEETGRKRGGNGEERGRKRGGKEEERGRKGEGKGDGVVEGANMMKMNQQEEMMKGERNSRNWIFILVSAG